MITKILNKILKKNIDNDWYNDGNIINYYCVYDNKRIIEQINAHEFAHRCKIWAFVNGYELRSGTISEDNGDMMFECSVYNKNADTSDNYFMIEFEDNNEPWTIFKACEYILEQIENK